MKNVFFAVSPNDLNVLKKRSPSDVIMLAADLNVLNKASKKLDTSLIDLNSFRGNYYSNLFWKKESLAISLTQKTLIKLTQLLPEYKNYLFPLQSRIEMAFLECIETYNCFKAIEATYNPGIYTRVIGDTSNKYNLYDQFSSFVNTLFESYVPQSKNETIVDQTSFFNTQKVQKKINLYSSLSLLGLSTFIKRKLRKQKKLQPSDIVFFSGGKNLLFYEKLIHSLNQDYKDMRMTILTGFQTLQDEIDLNKKNIKFVSLDSIDVSIEEKQVDAIFEQFIKKYKSFEKDLRTVFSKEDLQLSKALVNSLNRVVTSHEKNVIHKTMLAQQIIEQSAPKLLITTHDPGPNAMPFVLTAKDKKIETLVLMHGWQDTMLGVNHKSNHIAVWGPFIKTWYINKLKKNPSSIHSLGYPLLDDLFIQKKAFWQKKQSLPKFTSPVKLSILLTMYFPTTFFLPIFLDDIFRTIQTNHEDVSVSLRFHPGQSTSGIKERARIYGINIEIDNSTPLIEYLEDSDVVLSLDTTALIWAMILGKPLFYCAPDWGLGITPIESLGGAWIVHSPEELFSKINNLKKNKKVIYGLRLEQKNFLKNIVGVINGSSSEQHAKLISSLL